MSPGPLLQASHPRCLSRCSKHPLDLCWTTRWAEWARTFSASSGRRQCRSDCRNFFGKANAADILGDYILFWLGEALYITALICWYTFIYTYKRSGDTLTVCRRHCHHQQQQEQEQEQQQQQEQEQEQQHHHRHHHVLLWYSIFLRDSHHFCWRLHGSALLITFPSDAGNVFHEWPRWKHRACGLLCHQRSTSSASPLCSLPFGKNLWQIRVWVV